MCSKSLVGGGFKREIYVPLIISSREEIKKIKRKKYGFEKGIKT